MKYKDRQDAGQKLAKELEKYSQNKPIIIALPRGGVVVAYEIAKRLKAPLDIIIARKIGAPFNPEFGLGAISENGASTLDNEAIRHFGLTDGDVEQAINRENEVMSKKIELYRKGSIPMELKDQTVILVDDGLATGVTTKAAITSIKQSSPKRIILAVPVSPPDAINKLLKEVDEIVCLKTPDEFYAVSAYYDNFEQISDNEVINLLHKAKNV